MTSRENQHDLILTNFRAYLITRLPPPIVPMQVCGMSLPKGMVFELFGLKTGIDFDHFGEKHNNDYLILNMQGFHLWLRRKKNRKLQNTLFMSSFTTNCPSTAAQKKKKIHNSPSTKISIDKFWKIRSDPYASKFLTFSTKNWYFVPYYL